MSGITLPTNSQFKNLKGMRFGRLTVVGYAGKSEGNRVQWDCLCECGKTTMVITASLKSGHTRSCGCYQLDVVTRHGNEGVPEYSIWKAMLNRCDDVGSERYADYGGRGVTICRQWKVSYQAFIDDMGQRPTADHSIDRIDNNGDYSPGNCRWATRTEQARNKRNNLMFTHNGETRCLAEWAEKYGLKYKMLWSRLYRHGWRFERAISTPKRKYNE